eukprot:TRINITY_DN9136_c0_g1_i1.p1 TRINITY_DN9136_c0_g1~~TRINITY_DN9136_c0_g1_i1.p1  ORF type:complete len:137 (+),score=20.88 TRINITY_DN9136_c0_g1_i1:56-466(+)
MFRASSVLSTIKVVIHRSFKPHSLGLDGHKALVELKELALQQAGFVSSEVLTNVEDYHDQIIISQWETPEAWKQFAMNSRRQELLKHVAGHLLEPEDIRVYTPGAFTAGPGISEATLQNLRGGEYQGAYTDRRHDN